MSFTDAELAFLTEPRRLGRIATTSSAHVPDVAPVTYSVDGDHLVVTGMDITKTRKYFNVKATGTASMVIDDLASVDPWRPRGVKVTGRAVLEGGSIRIVPETIWSWGLNEGAEKRFGPIEKRQV